MFPHIRIVEGLIMIKSIAVGTRIPAIITERYLLTGTVLYGVIFIYFTYKISNYIAVFVTMPYNQVNVILDHRHGNYSNSRKASLSLFNVIFNGCNYEGIRKEIWCDLWVR